MPNYLETIYSREEFSENDYPQLLCNQIFKKYYSIDGDAQGKKLLDIGSGKGNHLIGFARLGLEPSGIDKRDECLKILDEFTIRECDIENEKFPYDDKTFDFVFSKSVLEHVLNADNFISETLRVLKPGGIVVFMVPDFASNSYNYWTDYTHVKAWNRMGLQNAMILHGFQDVKATLFTQLPMVWKFPWLKIVTKIIDIISPHSFKWKDQEETKMRPLIRFSKEKMVLGFGRKSK
mgnify:FL=1